MICTTKGDLSTAWSISPQYILFGNVRTVSRIWARICSTYPIARCCAAPVNSNSLEMEINYVDWNCNTWRIPNDGTLEAQIRKLSLLNCDSGSGFYCKSHNKSHNKFWEKRGKHLSVLESPRWISGNLMLKNGLKTLGRLLDRLMLLAKNAGDDS